MLKPLDPKWIIDYIKGIENKHQGDKPTKQTQQQRLRTIKQEAEDKPGSKPQ